VALAEREAVGYDRFPQGMAVREDVSSFQQFVMAEPADGAALPGALAVLDWRCEKIEGA